MYPFRTLYLRVQEEVGLAAVIVPSVSIDTILDLMVGLRVRTPNSLIVEEIKIDIRVEFMDQIDRNFVLSVCK